MLRRRAAPAPAQPELIARAIRFRSTLKQARASVSGIAWYPYDSLTNVQHLQRLLGEDAEAELGRLIGDLPCLDLGCGDGDLSFFLESLGHPVHAVDNPVTNFNGLRGVTALGTALQSAVQIRALDIDDQCNLPARYGVGFALGLIYHLKNPFLVLERLAQACSYVILSCRITSTIPGLPGQVGHLPIGYFLEETELNNDNSNFWIFTEACLQRMFARARLEVVRSFRLSLGTNSDPVTLDGDERGFYLLRSVYAMSHLELRSGWHEAEGDGWRWVEQEFSLGIAATGSGGQSMVQLRLFIPQALLDAEGPVTLEAFLEPGSGLETGGDRESGTRIGSRQYGLEGDQVFVAEFTAPAGTSCVLRFRTSHTLPPDPQDERERALIVASCKLTESTPAGPGPG